MEQRDGRSKRKLTNLHKELPDVVSVQPSSLQFLFWRYPDQNPAGAKK